MSTINEKINDIAVKEFKGNNSSFAKAMNTSEANIRNYRKGTMPKLDFIVKLHDFFEMSFEYLLSENVEIGMYEIEDPKTFSQDQDLLNKTLKAENNLLKERLEFLSEQIEFYKGKIEFLSLQTSVKKTQTSKEIAEGLRIIDEIENLFIKKSVK
ncbi:hypothetical protein BB050_00551 [Flavobacterium anhuiense]|uniref:HTH cro/C1-type domain-containing protein n=1 Tax=Flavobacterium anhuiense TaxID=459526 RepID=A0AAC9GGP9_9FLAO|nr:transcriptional regulator [Flavobacterium anhuiense]AOC93705.1 hypothetical protein BB050_00551 [Flavobacterium anhuiense]